MGKIIHMLSDLILTHAKNFGLIRMQSETMLDHIRQTAFSWTTAPGSVCLALNKKYYLQAYENANVVCIIAPPLAIIDEKPEICTIVVEKASDFFYFLHNLVLHRHVGLPENIVTGRISESAVIDQTAIIGNHVEIGKNVVIESGCLIKNNTIIGDDVKIGPKCVIGVDGFFSKNISNRKEHVKHYGGVNIGRNCMLHSGITISRSANYSDFTEIGPDVHVGHKSVIGHDCKIGKGTDISVNVLIAGRVTIGNDCWIGAGSSISNACSIGNSAMVRIGAVVISDIIDNAEYSGNFAISHQKHLRHFLKEK